MEITTPQERKSSPEEPDDHNHPQTPTKINNTITQPSKPIPLTNGVLKRHAPHPHHPITHHHQQLISFTYKECLKNHAASLGSHALDGCGEFMPSPTSISTDPTSLKCAACGCHRNFHRREPELNPISTPTTTQVIEYRPHHRHHPPPPPPRSPSSSSPPPISSSYYPAAPHMALLALSAGLSGSVLPESSVPVQNIQNNIHLSNMGTTAAAATAAGLSVTRKRFRTKFSMEQKEKMYEFAEKVGWKMQKKDEEIVQEFCNEVGVDKGVLKVWMHNNKNTLGKKLDGGRSNDNNNDIFEEHETQNDKKTLENRNEDEHYKDDDEDHDGSSSS